MDETEYRAQLYRWDEASIDKRVDRWKQLIPATFGMTLPNLIWYYINEADDLFIKGHFIGVVLLCAGVIELALSDRIISMVKITSKKVSNLRLEQKTSKCFELGILNSEEKEQLDKLRKLRNALIHAKAGLLTEIARERYKDWGLNISDLDPGLYLQPVWEGGIDKDALEGLQITRRLIVKFYGVVA